MIDGPVGLPWDRMKGESWKALGLGQSRGIAATMSASGRVSGRRSWLRRNECRLLARWTPRDRRGLVRQAVALQGGPVLLAARGDAHAPVPRPTPPRAVRRASGYTAPGPHRSKSEIFGFFQRVGVTPQGELSTRRWFVLESLQALNREDSGNLIPAGLERVVLRLADPREYGEAETTRAVIDHLNRTLSMEELVAADPAEPVFIP